MEDQYFDRAKDPGELQICLLVPTHNEEGGGDTPGHPKDVDTVLTVVKSSPRQGTIRVLVSPTDEAKVGDAIKMRASLTSPDKRLEQIFMVKISDPQKKQREPKKGDDPDVRLGLPEPVMVYKADGRSLIALSQVRLYLVPGT